MPYWLYFDLDYSRDTPWTAWQTWTLIRVAGVHCGSELCCLRMSLLYLYSKHLPHAISRTYELVDGHVGYMATISITEEHPSSPNTSKMNAHKKGSTAGRGSCKLTEECDRPGCPVSPIR